MEGRADPSPPAASPPPGPRRTPQRPFLPPRVTADRRPPAPSIPPGPSHQERGEPGREELPMPDGAGSRGLRRPNPAVPQRKLGAGQPAHPPGAAHRFRHLPGVLGTAGLSSCAAGVLRTASNGILSPACPGANPTPPAAAFFWGCTGARPGPVSRARRFPASRRWKAGPGDAAGTTAGLAPLEGPSARRPRKGSGVGDGG